MDMEDLYGMMVVIIKGNMLGEGKKEEGSLDMGMGRCIKVDGGMGR